MGSDSRSFTRFVAALLAMMSSRWQTGKPSTSTRRRQASSNVSMPSGAKTRSRSNGPFLSWTKSLPRSISAACASVEREAQLAERGDQRRPFDAAFSTKRSASCVVSGKPSRIAPDLPMKR